MLIGSDINFPLIGRILGIPSLLFGEDDINLIPQYSIFGFQFATAIVTPTSCNVGKWSYKTIKYNGYQKLAYLHPDNYNVNTEIVKKYKDRSIFILRFSGLDAYHDKGVKGFNKDIILKLIKTLENYGEVLITSENELDEDFKKYEINIDISNIHSLLYCASLLICDSQSMAVEAAMLGIPNIRFNDFAGKGGILNELEYKYKLTHSFNTYQSDKMIDKVNELINTQGLLKEWQNRKKKMLSDKINVVNFIGWFIREYPDSIKQYKVDTCIQNKFQ